jgi:two-component sensor histidine kinase/sensor domain CHASE-containing protein
MTLRKNTIIIISTTIICLIVVLFAASEIIFMESYGNLEIKDTHKDVENVQNALRDELSIMSYTANDWASWTATYNFIEDGNEEYINKNLMDSTFINLRLNLMLYVNSSGQIVFAKAVDLQNGTEVPFPQSFIEQISDNNALLRHSSASSSISGFVLLPEGPLLVASRPILHSYGQGPIKGSLIIGRYLNTQKIERLAQETRLSLAINRLDDPQMPLDFRDASSSLSKPDQIIVLPVSKESIAGYTMENDVYGKPIFMLRVDKIREIYQQGQIIMRYNYLLLLVAGVLFGIVTLGLLEKSVLSRLAYLTKNVSAIGVKGDHSGRIAITGKDELSTLAKEINDMLDALEHSQDELIKSKTKNLAILDAMPYLMFQIKKDGTFFNYKANNEEYLYVPPSKFLNKKVCEVMPEEIGKQIMHHIDQALQTGEIQIFQFHLTLDDDIHVFEARLVVSGKDEVLVIVNDITEHKKAEEAKKNEIMLKEIHHRVKNNLQVISSLLYLQSTYFTDNEVIEKFKESQNRVKLMALAHEKLYQSKDQASINLPDYIQNLTNFLKQSFGANSHVKLNLDIEDVNIGLDTALPCGLIINELVSNSFKHAFPAGEEGEINVIFKLENDIFILTVNDTGVGLPSDLDFRNTESLGLQLVNNLAEQIEGTIELDKRRGTAFTIKFKELQYKKRG